MFFVHVHIKIKSRRAIEGSGHWEVLTGDHIRARKSEKNIRKESQPMTGQDRPRYNGT